MTKRVEVPWSVREDGVVDRYVRRIHGQEFDRYGEAIESCRDSLRRVRPGLSPGRTCNAVRDRLRHRAGTLGVRLPRLRWSGREKQVVSDGVHAFLRGEILEVGAAVDECRKRLAGVTVGAARPEGAVRRRVRRMLDELGERGACRVWTPDEDRIVDDCARALAEGRVRRMRDAMPSCLEELARLREGRPERYRCIRVRTPLNVADRIWAVGRQLRPVRQQLCWEKWERGVLDRVARRYMAGEFETLRQAARVAHERLEAGRRRRHTGRGRPALRSRPGVGLKLRARLMMIGYRPKAQPPVWDARELESLHRAVDRYERTRCGVKPVSLANAAAMLRDELRMAGHRRSLAACRDRIRVVRRAARRRS